MASLPPLPTPKQDFTVDAQVLEQSSETQSQSSSPTQPTLSSSSVSAADADSSTLTDPVTEQPQFIPRHEEEEEEGEEGEEEGQTQLNLHDTRSPPPNASGSEPRKCWICFSDETEDSPLSSEWRSPCPCALVAHESCLLDWIADVQAPGTRKRGNAGAEIRCPQCRSEIVVARPRSLIVDAVSAFDRVTGRLIFPGLVAVFGGFVWSGCLAHGINTLYAIFGTEDAARILADRVQPGISSSQGYTSQTALMATFMSPFVTAASRWRWRLDLGVPLIPVVLVLSRTTLADSILPILPIIFFATPGSDREPLDYTRWPPSAAMSIAALPYLRGVYNGLYERAFGPSIRRWAKEMQPRSGEVELDAGEAAQGQADEVVAAEEIRDDDVLMEINVRVDLMDDQDGEDEEGPEDPAPEGAAVAADNETDATNVLAPDQVADGQFNADPLGPGAEQQQQEQQEQQPPPPPPPPQQPPHLQRANDLVISTGRLADTIIGALLFPGISSAMGSLLKRALPKAWTTARAAADGRPATGFLQTKWGRSIVGGCLFVVLKDSLILYARWEQARTHRHRRVLDYQKKKPSR